MGVQLKTTTKYVNRPENEIPEYVKESPEVELFYHRVYATFMEDKPKLWMFVPCDEEGNVMEEPMRVFDGAESDPELIYQNELAEYREAEQKVIFEGFKIEKSSDDDIYFLRLNNKAFSIISYNKIYGFTKITTIELLLRDFPNLEVTQSKAKELGLI